MTTVTTAELSPGDTILTGKFGKSPWLVVGVSADGPGGHLVTLRHPKTGAESTSFARTDYVWTVSKGETKVSGTVCISCGQSTGSIGAPCCRNFRKGETK